MVFIIDLNSLSAASSYQEWFQIKARASKQDQVFIFYNAQTPRLIIETSMFRGGFYLRKYGKQIIHGYYCKVLFTELVLMYNVSLCVCISVD